MKKSVFVGIFLLLLVIITAFSVVIAYESANALNTSTTDDRDSADAITNEGNINEADKEVIGVEQQTSTTEPTHLGFDLSKDSDAMQNIADIFKSKYFVGEKVTLLLNPFFANYNCAIDFGDGNLIIGRCSTEFNCVSDFYKIEEAIGVCGTEYFHVYSFPGEYKIEADVSHGDIKRKAEFNIQVVEKPQIENNATTSANLNRLSIKAGQTAVMRINRPDVAFTFINFIAKNELNNANFDVTTLPQIPHGLSKPSARIYQYISIAIDNAYPDDISRAFISFSVKKRWIDENKLKITDIALFRYSANGWNSLPTRVISIEKERANYEAESTSFSIFAIGERVVKERLPSEKVETNELGNVLPGQPALLKFRDTDIPFKQIKFVSKHPLRNIRIKVANLIEKPKDIDSPHGRIYQYLNITTGNFNDSDIEKVVITFTVQKSWLDNNNIAQSNITLQRHSNSVWNRLNTRIADTTGDFVTYEAQSHGFSIFAVSGINPNDILPYLPEIPDEDLLNETKDNVHPDNENETMKNETVELVDENGEKDDKQNESMKNEPVTLPDVEKGKNDTIKNDTLQKGENEKNQNEAGHSAKEIIEKESKHYDTVEKKEEIKQEIKSRFFDELSPVKIPNNGELRGRSSIKVIRSRTPDAIIIQEPSNDRIVNILQEISTSRYVANKAKFVLQSITPKERDISQAQIDYELEHLSNVVVEDASIIAEDIKNSFVKFEEVKKNIELKKEVHYLKDTTKNVPENLTVVSVKITPKKGLKNFTIYEEIPKEVAKDISDVIFYDTNYKVIESDPLVVWNFEDVDIPVEVTYGIRGRVEVENLSKAVTVPISQQIVEDTFAEERKSPSQPLYKIILPLMLVPIFGILIIYYYKLSGSSKEKDGSMDEYQEEVIIRKQMQLVNYVESEIKRGVDMTHIRRELLAKHWPDNIIYDVFRALTQKDDRLLEYYIRKISIEVRRLMLKGLSREEITMFLIKKKHYSKVLIDKGFRYAG